MFLKMCTFSFICENDLFICDIILFSHAKISSGNQSIIYENVEFACKKKQVLCFIVPCVVWTCGKRQLSMSLCMLSYFHMLKNLFRIKKIHMWHFHNGFKAFVFNQIDHVCCSMKNLYTFQFSLRAEWTELYWCSAAHFCPGPQSCLVRPCLNHLSVFIGPKFTVETLQALTWPVTI